MAGRQGGFRLLAFLRGTGRGALAAGDLSKSGEVASLWMSSGKSVMTRRIQAAEGPSARGTRQADAPRAPALHTQSRPRRAGHRPRATLEPRRVLRLLITEEVRRFTRPGRLCPQQDGSNPLLSNRGAKSGCAHGSCASFGAISGRAQCPVCPRPGRPGFVLGCQAGFHRTGPASDTGGRGVDSPRRHLGLHAPPCKKPPGANPGSEFLVSAGSQFYPRTAWSN